jgi:hypothetical protein
MKRICSLRFQEHCFDRTGQTTRLRDYVIPTLILPALPNPESVVIDSPIADGNEEAINARAIYVATS